MDNLATRAADITESTLISTSTNGSSEPSFTQIRNDFIRHPQQFPIEVRRVRRWDRTSRDINEDREDQGDLGLSFVSRKYVATGTEMELAIPLRGDVQKFHGQVVMVREIVGGYEIGIWLASADEASRARIVEQICHTECYLQAKNAQKISPQPLARKTTRRPAVSTLLNRALPN